MNVHLHKRSKLDSWVLIIVQGRKGDFPSQGIRFATPLPIYESLCTLRGSGGLRVASSGYLKLSLPKESQERRIIPSMHRELYRRVPNSSSPPLLPHLSAGHPT
jgi:hypothetical protein